MPSFSQSSMEKLMTCDERLQELFLEVVKNYDCSVVCGYRGEEAQQALFKAGFSKLSYPHSKHNQNPSLAVDVIPYPVKWDDMKSFCHFAGYVSGIAHQLGLKLRWGGDFNRDYNLSNDRFVDLPHFELE